MKKEEEKREKEEERKKKRERNERGGDGYILGISHSRFLSCIRQSFDTEKKPDKSIEK